MMAAIGREQSEGTLGPVLSQSEVDTIGEQISAIQTQMAEADAKGDSKAHNALYQKELALREKMVGNEPVVGAHGRVV
jgi:hypothetical protein